MLEIAETDIKDISPLAESEALRVLDIRKTPVTDLSPLHKLPDLRMVTLSPTVPQQQIDTLEKAKPKVRITVRN